MGAVALVAAVMAAGCSKDNSTEKLAKLESFTVLDEDIVLYADADEPEIVSMEYSPENADLNGLKWELPDGGQVTVEVFDGHVGLRGMEEGQYALTVSAEGIEKTQTVNVTVKERKFIVMPKNGGSDIYDVGRKIFTTELESGNDGKSVAIYVRIVDGSVHKEDVSVTPDGNSLISGIRTEYASDETARVWLTLGAEAGSSDFALTYKEEENSYTQHFTLAVPKDITAEFDPDFAKILEWGRAVKDHSHITDADAMDVTEVTTSIGQDREETYRSVASFRGIEHLANLKLLQIDISYEMPLMKDLDLSKNTKLTIIRISSMKSLETLKLPESVTNLSLYSTVLKDVDFSRCVNLYNLTGECPSWENLDLSNCTELGALRLYGSGGGPAKVDLSGCVKLEYLTINNRDSNVEGKLAELKLPARSEKLWDVRILNHSITEFPCGDYPKLNFLAVKCRLTEMDIRTFPNLRSFGCDQNPGKDGKFIVTAWFDDSSIPEGFTLHYSSWKAADGTDVKVEFRKGQ